MTFDATRLTSLRRVSDVALSPDESWLAVSVSRVKEDESGYVSDLWRVDVSGNDEPRQLTFGEQSDSSPRFRADGSLGFLSARGEGDDKKTQVWLLPSAGGEAAALTDAPLGVLSFRFGGAVLAYLAREWPGVDPGDQREHAAERKRRGESALLYKNNQVRHWDHWMPMECPRFFIAEGDSARPLTPEATDEFRDFDFGLGWDLSADGSRIVTESRELAGDRLYDSGLELIETATGEREWLAKSENTWITSPVFAPDGQSVAALAAPRPIGEWFRSRLMVYAKGAEPRELAADFEGVPAPPIFAGDSLLFTAAIAGEVPVYRVELSGGELTRLSSKEAAGSHQSLGAGEKRVFGIRHTVLSPPEPFAIDNAPHAAPTLVARLSGLEPGETDFATVSRHETTAADGSQVPWFLVAPHGQGPHPAQLWIHGGPLGQWQDGWHWRWNPLVAVAAGYACALPNPRGSIGLGAKFANEIWNNKWGAECYTDLMSVTDDLAARADVDENRMAALGGSFGGYMANWIGTQTDRFRCLVSHAGIYHFPAFYATTDHPPYWRMQMAGDPYSDPQEFVRYSPHRHIDNWKTPVLVIHGELDYRVPISEALLLFDALRDRRIEAELLVFPNENHWILKPHNSRRWYGEVLRFIGEHL